MVEDKLTKKQRVRTALSHREPDRVPIFELTVANPILETIIGRKIPGFATAEAKITGIRAGLEGREVRRAIIRENVEGMLEMYDKVGFDMFWWRPHEYIPAVDIGLFDNITANYIFDINIEEIDNSTYRIESKDHRFWSTEKYDEQSESL